MRSRIAALLLVLLPDTVSAAGDGLTTRAASFEQIAGGYVLGHKMLPAGTPIEISDGVDTYGETRVFADAGRMRADLPKSSFRVLPTPPPSLAKLAPVVVPVPPPATVGPNDIKTPAGRIYRDVHVGQVDPDGINCTFLGGAGKIPFEELPEQVQKHYAYDPAKASAYRESEIKAQQMREIEERRQHEADVRASLMRNIHTVREVSTDMTTFVGKPFVILREIDISSYYNWGYGDAQSTHFAFEIRDGTGHCYAYMLRDEGAAVRDQILKAGGSLKGAFIVYINPSRHDAQQGELMLELKGASPPLSQ